MKLLPAILTDSITTLQSQVELVRESPLIETIHIDVIDGLFADNLTVTPVDLIATEFAPLTLDFHLMTEEPMDYVYELGGVKEYLPIRRVYGQVERMSFQADFLQEVRVNGWEGGLALDLFTPLDAIDDDVWQNLSALLLMSVEAGQQGETFHDSIFAKIKEVSEHVEKSSSLSIVLDGGIKQSLLPKLRDAQIAEAVVGSAIWQAAEPLHALEELHRI